MSAFEGHTAFITGGASGFGLAFAKALGERGAAVVLADLDEARAATAAQQLTEAGIKALPVRVDVGDAEQVRSAVEEAGRRFGGLDILINNAGRHLTRYNRPFCEQPPEDLRALFDTNVMGVINCSVACKDLLHASGRGTILNIASIGGYISGSPYGVSKLAVRGLTMAFAKELAPYNVRVNAIAPGLIATENAMDDLSESFVITFREQLQLIHRTGEVQDIVNATLFLCSEQASFVTGETLKVSGGYPLNI